MNENTTPQTVATARKGKRKLMAGAAVLTGAALLSAGGYAAYTSSATAESGKFSVTATPDDEKPGPDAEMALMINGVKNAAVNVSLKGLANNSASAASDDLTFTNAGAEVAIEQLALADVSVNDGGENSKELQEALTVSLTAKEGGDAVTGTLAELVADPAKFTKAIQLDPAAANSSVWTLKVAAAKDLTAAKSQAIDSVTFNFTGTDKV